MVNGHPGRLQTLQVFPSSLELPQWSKGCIVKRLHTGDNLSIKCVRACVFGGRCGVHKGSEGIRGEHQHCLLHARKFSCLEVYTRDSCGKLDIYIEFLVSSVNIHVNFVLYFNIAMIT